MQNVTEIRLEILKNEGQGYSKAETVKNISEKLKVSKQDVYYHYSIRGKWQSDFINYQDAKELHNIIVSRLNHIYREASFQYLHADNSNSNAKCGFLNIMLDATMKLMKACTVTATSDSQPSQIILKWLDSNPYISKDTAGVIQHLIEIKDPDDARELLKQYENTINETAQKEIHERINELIRYDVEKCQNYTEEEKQMLVSAREVLKRHENDQVEQESIH